MSEAPFSAEHERLLACVLDGIIPPRPDGLPGAGGLGLAATVGEALGDLVPILVQALDELDARAVAGGSAGFEALAPEERAALLDAFVAERPDLQGALSFHTYAAYYQHPRVLEAIGLEARPPYPGGYPLEEGDLTLLDRVRARAPFYRAVDDGA